MARSGGFIAGLTGIVALVAAASGWASSAQAGQLVYTLVNEADGFSTQHSFSEGEPLKLTLALYANISGSNPGLLIGGGSFVASSSSSTTSGFFDNPTIKPNLYASGASLGTPNSVGNFTNWGSINYYYVRSINGPVTPVFGNQVKMGTIDFTITNLEPGEVISLQFEPRRRPTLTSHIWFEDYVAGFPPTWAYSDVINGSVESISPDFLAENDMADVDFDENLEENNASGMTYILGEVQTTTPFSVIFVPAPEPASLGLLSIGALALVRRRKNC